MPLGGEGLWDRDGLGCGRHLGVDGFGVWMALGRGWLWGLGCYRSGAAGGVKGLEERGGLGCAWLSVWFWK